MHLTVSEAAERCGVSVRTLHYYDEIGLVKPSEVSESGYRYYDAGALARLERVIFYRELEFSLSEIAAMIDSPRENVTGALLRHREWLLLKRRRLDELVRLIDETMGGLQTMNHVKTTLADMEAARRQYADEVRERWGETEAYQESQRRDQASDPRAAEEADRIFAQFAAIRDKSPSDPDALALVRAWQEHITRWHYQCTDQILACLGGMYVSDERFARQLDRYGEGCAQFMSEAIAAYVRGRV